MFSNPSASVPRLRLSLLLWKAVWFLPSVINYNEYASSLCSLLSRNHFTFIQMKPIGACRGAAYPHSALGQMLLVATVKYILISQHEGSKHSSLIKYKSLSNEKSQTLKAVVENLKIKLCLMCRHNLNQWDECHRENAQTLIVFTLFIIREHFLQH